MSSSVTDGQPGETTKSLIEKDVPVIATSLIDLAVARNLMAAATPPAPPAYIGQYLSEWNIREAPPLKFTYTEMRLRADTVNDLTVGVHGVDEVDKPLRLRVDAVKAEGTIMGE